jgi:hypothetical protein
MMRDEGSAVLEFGAPEPGETATTMGDKLRFHTDDQCERGPGGRRLRHQASIMTGAATNPEKAASFFATY